MNATRRWLLLAALLSSAAVAQTHVKQPFIFLWDWTGLVDRFELRLDAGAYTNVGLPPVAAGTYTLKADSTITGSHSAVVRACTVAAGCTPDSNMVDFVVDVPAPAPIPAAPTGLKLVASVAAPPPPGPVESPSGTKVTASGAPPNFVLVGLITDAKLLIWTLGPKDPLVEGGVEFVILHGGTREGGAAVYLCYFNHLVYAWSTGLWFQQTALNGFQSSPIVPTGC